MRKYVDQENENNLSADGPFGRVARDLGKENTRSERLGLYVIWRENRGNVKISIDDVFNEITTENDQNFDENEPIERKSNCGLQSQGLQSQELQTSTKSTKHENDIKTTTSATLNLEVSSTVEKDNTNCGKKGLIQTTVKHKLQSKGLQSRPKKSKHENDKSASNSGNLNLGPSTQSEKNKPNSDEKEPIQTKGKRKLHSMEVHSTCNTKVTKYENDKQATTKSAKLNKKVSSKGGKKSKSSKANDNTNNLQNENAFKLIPNAKDSELSHSISNSESYCICGANEGNWQKEGAMIQCDICNQWYHFTCINLAESEAPDSNTPFECGLNNCRSLSLNGISAEINVQSNDQKLAKNELDKGKQISEKEKFISKLGLKKVNLVVNEIIPETKQATNLENIKKEETIETPKIDTSKFNLAGNSINDTHKGEANKDTLDIKSNLDDKAEPIKLKASDNKDDSVTETKQTTNLEKIKKEETIETPKLDTSKFNFAGNSINDTHKDEAKKDTLDIKSNLDGKAEPIKLKASENKDDSVSNASARNNITTTCEGEILSGNNAEIKSRTKHKLTEAVTEFGKIHSETIPLATKVIHVESLNTKEVKHTVELLNQKLESLHRLDCLDFKKLKNQKQELIDIINIALHDLENLEKNTDKEVENKVTEILTEIEHSMNMLKSKQKEKPFQEPTANIQNFITGDTFETEPNPFSLDAHDDSVIKQMRNVEVSKIEKMNESKQLETNSSNINTLQSKNDTTYTKTCQEFKKHYEESMTLMAKIVITENMDIKEIRTIEEILTKKLITLDGIDCKGYLDIRRRRKDLIDLINLTLDKLESSNNEQEESCRTNLSKHTGNQNIEVPDLETGENECNINSNANIQREESKVKEGNIISQTLAKPKSQDIKNSDSINIVKNDSDGNSDSDDGSNSNDSDFNDGLFSKSTVSSVLGHEIPKSGFFTKGLNKVSKFNLEDNIFDKLYQQRSKRCFKRGTWQSYFVKGLKESNPFCVFKFKHHQVSTADKYQLNKNQRIFWATGCCTFSNCDVEVKLEMFDKKSVRVAYTGNIKHDVNEQHCRYIRGDERKELKEEFKGGIKPLAKYLESIKKHTPEELIAGNIDGFGKDTRVLNQIACESRQEGRKSDNELASLITQQKDMKKDCPLGFIQKICAKPLYVCYWSKNGLLIYHDRAANNALFWDATGSIIRRTEDGKQILYYELAIRHPVKGKMGIPVTSMVSSDQSLPVISDWLKCFRHAEKKQFGYNNIVTPKLIISDQAMVFIMAALQEFNGENVNDFLNRAWKMVNNETQYDSNKTLVHLCASHFMNSCKKYIEKKISKSQKTPFLFMIGLLMNCECLTDAKELLLDIFVLLNSPTLNDVNSEHYDRLKRKINTYETSAEHLDTNNQNVTNESNDQNTNTNLFTEEEYHAAGTTSKFREWANCISEDAQLITSKIDISLPVTNSWYSPEFFQYLKNKLMPIYPLWSVLLMSLPGFNQDIVKTNSTIENRFRILKHICLNNRSQFRIDEFSDALFTQSVAIQKLSCLESLKFRNKQRYTRKRKSENKQPGKKITQETTEPWNKKKQQPFNFKDKQGKYQKPPTTEVGAESPKIQRKLYHKEKTAKQTNKRTVNLSMNIDNDFKDSSDPSSKNKKQNKTNQITTLHSHPNLCTMPNLGNTCWFNSFIQSLAASKFSKRIIEKLFSIQSICVDDFDLSPKENALKSIGDLLWHMTSDGKGKRVPIDILHSTVRKVVNAIPGFTQSNQQDVHEFNTRLFGEISNQLHEYIQFTSISTCSSCKTKNVSKNQEGQSLVFSVLPEVDNITVQTLADNLITNDVRSQECSNCKQDQPHDVTKIISSSPTTLFVILGRYANSGNKVQKLHNNIHVNEQLIIPSETGNVHYKLKSIICHEGESTTSGHYTAVIKTDEGYYCCDDLRLYNVDLDFTLDTAYVILYDKVDCKIPSFIEPWMECFSRCTGVQEILGDSRLKSLNKSKVKFLRSLVEHGFSQCVKDEFLTLFVPYVENILKVNFESLTAQLFYEAFLKYMMYEDSSVGPLLSAEYMEICSKHVWKCHLCGLLDIVNENKTQIILNEFNHAAIQQSMKQIQGNRVLTQCKCISKKRNVVVTSVPSSMVIHVKNCQNLSNELAESIDLKHVLPFVIESNSTKFNIGTLLCKENESYFWAVNTSNGIFQIEHGERTEKKIELSSVSEATLFLDKTIENGYTDLYIERIQKNEFTMTNENKMPKINRSQPYCQLTNSSINGVKINKKFLSTINDSKKWLTSDNINVYMHLLSQDSTKCIHIVDSGWFSHCLLKNGNPERLELLLTKTESKKSWFDFDLVIIPVNESNKHWTLVAVSIKDKNNYFLRFLQCKFECLSYLLSTYAIHTV